MADVRINVTASTEQAKAALNNLDGSMNKLKTSTGGLKTGLINFNMALQAANTVLNAAKQAYDATAGATVKYAAQVRDLNRITGAGAEETSRLIQVADDLTISYESLEQAAKIAAKNGIEFTTGKLAEMSAEYQALNPGQERAAYLLEKFGKNGLEMGKMLETPTDQLIKMTGAIDDNMLMTEEAVQQARAFEIAQDNLADAIQGAKYAIGNEMIPVLVKAANALTLVTTATKGLEGVLAEHETDVRKTSDTYDDYIKEMVRAGLVAKQFEGAEVNLAKAFLDGTLETEKQDAVLYMLTNSVGAVSEGTWKVTRAMEGATPASQAWMDELDRGGPLVSNLNDELQELVDKGIDNLKTAMSGAVGGEMEDFKTKSGEIFDKMKDVSGQIQTLKDKKWLTKEQQDELVNLETEYGNLQTSLSDTATAHEDAMHRISYSLLEARLGIDGFTQAELDVLNNYAGMTGMIDEPTRMLNESISMLTTQWENGKQPVDDYMTAFEYLNESIKDGVITAGEMQTALELLNGREINIGINVKVKGDPIPDFGIDDPDAAIPTGPDDEIGGAGEVPYSTGGYIPPGGRGVVGEETVTGMPGGGAVVTNNHNYSINMGVQANENAVINRLRILEAFGV